MKLIKYFLIGTLLVLNFACSGVYTYSDPNYTPPTIAYKPRIIYPSIAKENNWKGKAIILLNISEEGDVISTSVLGSSGYDVLDKTAEDYCKNLQFNPALNIDTPVQSYLKMQLEFDLNSNTYSVNEYVQKYVDEINSLYEQIKSGKNVNKSNLQGKILAKHKNFITQTRDANSFSKYINLVVQPKIVLKWQGVWNYWPLSFLIYHDFLDRYENCEKADSVKIYLFLALKEDVNYIINSSNNSLDKEVVINEIISFMKNEYPNINIDSINFNIKSKTKLII